MSRVIIKNIGPISNVELNLNKVNIIMGPQSSGKSTIAKIISYCQWVEKRFVLDGEYREDFTKRFKEFHRIGDSYFNKDSFIEYVGEAVSISYKGFSTKPTITRIKKEANFLNSKNIYIPAERNFVSVIPNLGKYKGSDDNIMNFLYDWYEVKKKYPKQKKLSLLNLDVSYFHIPESDSDKLILNKNKKELNLDNASSGLQSLTPMLLLIDFLTNGLYNEKTTESVDEKNEMKNIFIKHFSQLIEKEDRKKELLKQIKDKRKVTLIKDEIDKISQLIAARRQYHFSQFIIEEPEQNLFPKTQRDLIYYIIKLINNPERNHKVLITTHSPYILYALNNCMLGFLVKDDMPEVEKETLKSNLSWINPDLVSVWEIEENKGTLVNIKNEDTKTISKHYFNKIMNEVMDEYYEMLSYLKV